MSRIWEEAAGLLETAAAAADMGAAQLAIVTGGGSLRILDASGWTLDGLRREHGASSAYLVKRSGQAVTVEGQSGSESCRLRSSVPTAILGAVPFPRHLLACATRQ